jgi:hypothetical protein
VATYRVIDVEHDARGAFTGFVVKTDTGTKLSGKSTLTEL